MINPSIQIGYSGLRNAYAGMMQSSQNIADAVMEKDGAGMQDMMENLVSLKKNQLLFDASAKVLKTSDKMLGTLLDIRA